MPQFVNFFENLKEAQMRLRGTVVLYDGQPYYVLAITNHKADGKFRIYLDPIGRDPLIPVNKPGCIHDYGPDYPALGTLLDTWMTQYPNSGILRKQMDSPLFNKYRPFPLGMCNMNGKVLYIERMPTRKTEQGLTRSMLNETQISAMPDLDTKPMGRATDLMSREFKACVLGRHPTAQECLDALKDPAIENEAAAFHRCFALVRGPIGMIFLAYKEDIVGVLPNTDFSTVRLGTEYIHTKEVVQALNLFGTVTH